jgi:uncharacterized protein YdeI (YjbR/CyaY-like superfamily)
LVVEGAGGISLSIAGARAKFDGLPFTHRKEFARWVAEAKRRETRERRVAQALEMLRTGKTRS